MTDAILSKIAKLLALSTHNTSEAEAALAAEHVQRLLQEHNLTLSQVEAASSGSPSESREKLKTKHHANMLWQRTLMRALADNNFCYHTERDTTETLPDGTLRLSNTTGRTYVYKVHFLIGRALNVRVTLDMYDYLTAAIRRAAQTAGFPLNKRTRELTFFFEGAANRIVERLRDRRREEERRAQTVPQAGNGSHRELTVTDVYGSEADLNNDALNGFPPGTTATKRRTAARREAKRTAKEAELIAAGVDSTEAFYRSHGYGPEEAKTYAESWRKQRPRRGGRGRSQNWTRSDDHHYEKINSPAYTAGRTAGNNVGLDSQVGASSSRALPKA